MTEPTLRSPIIIAGMHRSGTTLLARMLMRMGVFLGWRREENEEARTFLEINKWLLLQAGGAWDLPPHPEFFHETESRTLCTRFMTYAMNSVWMSFYLGRPYLSFRQVPPRFARQWGWKDPRNTITLPLWSDLYPDAKVIHVTRHGVDVAQSLTSRRIRRIRRMAEKFPVRKHAFWFRLRKRRFETGHGSLQTALQLWEQYQKLAEHGCSQFSTSTSVRFEDLVTRPAAVLRDLASILELDADEELLESAATMPEAGREFAYRDDDRLIAFAKRNADLLQRWGYEA